MSNHTLRALAGATSGVLLAAGLWIAAAASLVDRSVPELQRAVAEASLSLQRQLTALVAEGQSAWADVRAGEDFSKSVQAFEKRAEQATPVEPSKARLSVVGVVEFLRREDRWELRRSQISGDGGQTPGDAAEALRVDALQIADLIDAALADRPELGATVPRIMAPNSVEKSLWIIWPESRGSVAMAALVAIDAAPAALGLGEFEDPQIDSLTIGAQTPQSVIGPTAAAAPEEARPSAEIAFNLGAQRASLPVSVAVPNRFSIDPTISIPLLGLAALVFGALYLTLRSQRKREEEISVRQRAIVESFAQKQTELEDTEARFRHLAESTNVIPWRVDLDANRFTYIGPQIEELSGYPASTWRAEGFWMQHIFARDRNRVRAEAAEKAKTERHFTLKYRIRNASGEILHIRNMLSVTRVPRPEGGFKMDAQGFMLDVTDQVKADEQLKMAHATAEHASSVKTAFLTTMSHELRTPLNAIIGFSEIMKDELFGPLTPQYQDYSASIYTSGQHLLKLINDILDLSKIEAGRFELHEEPTDIDALIEECRQLMQERISTNGLEFTVQTDPGLPEILMDERRMKQVMLNLLSNAAKFTDEGGEITLSARRIADDGVAISVEDTGVGMSAEEIPLALDTFGQIDSELSRKHDGTGLGLPIANSLTKLHDGELIVESAKGVGTKVTIALPESRVIETDAPGRAAG